MMAEKKRLEALLKAYKKETDIGPDKDRLEQTIRLSKNTFYRNEQKQTASYMEFLIQQGAYIRKDGGFYNSLHSFFCGGSCIRRRVIIMRKGAWEYLHLFS